jgi:formate/nitrite transporter
MATRAEEIGARKASLDAWSTLALAGLAGAFIALGAVFATIALSGTSAVAWGPAHVLAGTVFSLGLVLVVVGGAELFTGNTLIAMAWAGGRVSTRSLLRNWTLVYAGNFAGAVATAVLVYLARTHELGDGAVGVTALSIATAKVRLGFVQAVTLGILCNVLVCLAVWMTFSARTTLDRVAAVVPPIAAFVASGFEHCIANMYFVPHAILMAVLDPGFAATRALDVQGLGWEAFLLRNLVPVTIGNVIGGTLLVGGVYWSVYLRGRR